MRLSLQGGAQRRALQLALHLGGALSELSGCTRCWHQFQVAASFQEAPLSKSWRDASRVGRDVAERVVAVGVVGVRAEAVPPGRVPSAPRGARAWMARRSAGSGRALGLLACLGAAVIGARAHTCADTPIPTVNGCRCKPETIDEVRARARVPPPSPRGPGAQACYPTTLRLMCLRPATVG